MLIMRDWILMTRHSHAKFQLLKKNEMHNSLVLSVRFTVIIYFAENIFYEPERRRFSFKELSRRCRDDVGKYT